MLVRLMLVFMLGMCAVDSPTDDDDEMRTATTENLIKETIEINKTGNKIFGISSTDPHEWMSD